jgi:hypothetical protein
MISGAAVAYGLTGGDAFTVLPLAVPCLCSCIVKFQAPTRRQQFFIRVNQSIVLDARRVTLGITCQRGATVRA